ncbi:MAG: PD40 domain-containing protein [Gemmatimonadetes bacterium]|nr:PD40 domain-containing protein [Gemmatimonadota bacterium]
MSARGDCVAPYVMNADGSGVVRVNLVSPLGDRLCGPERDNVWWSPDGSRLAFLFFEDLAGGEDQENIYVINANGSGITQLTGDPASDIDPAWSPDGTRLAWSRGDIYVINADGSGVTRVTNGFNASDPAWSPDGTRLAFASRWDIYVVNADGSGVVRLTNHPAWDGNARWSPDGAKLAFLSERDDTLRRVDRRKEIYVINADGSGLRNLTNDSANDFGFVWSPDGGRLAFVSDRRGDRDIYVVNTDGSGLTVHGFPGAEDTDPAWSLDGTMLVFASEATGDFDIYVMNADGSGLRNLTDNPADDRFPVWLPTVQRSPATASAAGSQPAASPAPAAPLESFGPRFAPLERELAPLLASVDSAQARLRRDSGMARADSAFVAFHSSFAARVPYWGEDFENWLQSDSAAYDSTQRYFSSRGMVLRSAEGEFWVTEDPDFLVRRLGAYLTRPMRRYLEIRGQEKYGYEADGGLYISWDELADRIVTWEEFLEANPGFARWDSLWNEAQGWYARYLSAYVSGLENTPLFDGRPPLGPYGTGTLDRDVRASYERLVARHGGTQSARFVRGLLDVLGRSGYMEGPEREEYLQATPWPTPGRRRPGS